MILFSPAKVNIGLRIIERREDGFHNLQSIMYPVGMCDILEIVEAPEGSENLSFGQSGIKVDCADEENLCVKAWEIFTRESPLPPVMIHLHKLIPIGAGLGGGSSNASAALRGLNSLARKTLSDEKLHEMASELGSDCPFFLHERPMLMEGRGDILSPFTIHVDHLYMVLLFPELHISTSEAYAGLIPSVPSQQLIELIDEPIEQWKDRVINDFEHSVFNKFPPLEQIKQSLYDEGAVYASLSGSGSSLFGLFHTNLHLPRKLEQYIIWRGNVFGNKH